MAERVEFNFSVDDSEAIQALERILELTEGAAKGFDDLDAEQKQTFEQLAKSLGIAESEFGDLVQAAGKYKDEIGKASKQTSAFRDEVKRSVRDIRIFGTSVGEAVDFLSNKARALRAVVGGLGAGSKALKIFRAALISTGIGAAVVALGSLVAVLSKTQRGIDFANRVLAVMQSIVDNVIERMARLGDAFGLFVRGKFGQAFDVVKEAAAGFGQELIADAVAADQLEVASQRLQDRQRELGVEISKTRQRIEQLRLSAEDATKSTRERAEALKEATRLEDELGQKQLELKQEELRILKERNSLGESLRSDLEAEARLEGELSEIRGEVARRQRALASRQRELSRQQVAQIEEQQKAVLELVEDLKDISASYEGIEAVSRRALQLQINKLKELRQAVVDAGIADEFAAELSNVDDLIAALQTRLRDGTVDELDFLSSLPDQIESETAESFSDAGEALGRALGQGIEQEAARITDEQKAFLRDQFLSVFDSITSIFLANTEAQIEAQQRVVDARQDAVNDLRGQLAEEQRLREQGFANNASAVKEALTAETALLQAEEKKRLKLEKRAARERLVINSFIQVAETTSAVAKLLSRGASGFIPGLIAAAAGVALLFKILASAKAQARDAAAVPRFREGTPELIGPSHERGGILLEAEGGERIVSRRLNQEIGGRTLTNDELIKTYKIGRKVQEYLTSSGPIFPSMPYTLPGILEGIRQNREAAQSLELEQHTERLERAYREASRSAAKEIISYMKTRPVRKPTADGELVEWQEGNALRRTNIRNSESE